MKDIKLLGLKAMDKVTGFTGIITSISYDLYGCVMAVLSPEVGKDNQKDEGRWFDTKRLNILSTQPVMEVPDFETVPGGDAKSLPPERQ